MKESKLFKCLVVTFVAIVIGGPAVVLASTHDYYEGILVSRTRKACGCCIDAGNAHRVKSAVPGR